MAHLVLLLFLLFIPIRSYLTQNLEIWALASLDKNNYKGKKKGSN